MAAISLPLPRNVLHEQPQTLSIDKIAAFVGGNGSGKSTILKSIFDEKLKGNDYQDYKVVCFSSGQNESYSKNFGDYLNSERAKRNALNLDCFYYDKVWSKLLIFLATTSDHEGLVRGFLRSKNYIVENELDEDESTELAFDVEVNKAYIRLVSQAKEDEESGDPDVRTNKAYHRTLYNFINALVDQGYEFDKPVEKRSVQLNQDAISRISFETDDHSSFDSKVMFFTQAADNNYFIDKGSLVLSFNNDGRNLFLEDLSDGEYQLLFLYALIDLFDSETTLFLFDEADSHLHYKNIESLWGVFSDSKGMIITTTHLLDSISKAGPKRLSVIEHGVVASGSSSFQLLQRLESLSEIESVQHKIVSMFKNVVVMDHAHDWEIFKLLVKRKLGGGQESDRAIDESLADFVCVSVASSYHGGNKDKFADKKVGWVSNYAEYLHGVNEDKKRAFVICDRDDYSINHVGNKKSAFHVQGLECNFPKPLRETPVLSWRRREIKHYLLSFTALREKINRINDELAKKCQMCEGDPGDYKASGEYNNQLAQVDSRTVKDILDPHINIPGYGFCVEKTQAYVNTMPVEEISEDIVNMYSYLVKNNE